MTSPAGSASPKLALALKAIVGLVVSAAALYWALSGVDLGHVKENWSRTSAGAVALYFLAFVVIHVARCVRYHLLVGPLLPAGEARSFLARLRPAAAATSVGIPAAFFLPLRLGELVRPVMMARAGVPLAAALASVVVERAVDGLFNVGVFFASLLAMPEGARVPDEVRAAAVLALVAFGGSLGFLALAYLARGPVLGLTGRLLDKVSPAFSQRVVALLTSFLDGLKALGTPGRALAFLGLTTLYWGLNSTANWYLARSYGLPLPVVAGPFTMACVVFAVSVPSAPGFAGIFQAGFRIGMAPFGVSPSDALVVSLAAHVLQVINLTAVALFGFQIVDPSQRKRESAPT